MEAIQSLLAGFEIFLTPQNFLMAVAGVLLGAVGGVLPGLGVANGVGHVFYDGRYIGTELLPIEFVDYARSRPTTFEEASDFEILFSASGWR